MDKEKPFLVLEFNALMDWSAWECSKMDGTFRDTVHRAVLWRRTVAPWRLTFATAQLTKLIFYKSGAGMGTLVFTGSENWAPIPFS